MPSASSSLQATFVAVVGASSEDKVCQRAICIAGMLKIEQQALSSVSKLGTTLRTNFSDAQHSQSIRLLFRQKNRIRADVV